MNKMDKQKLQLFQSAIERIIQAQRVLTSQENLSKDKLREASFELGSAVGMLHSIEIEERRNNKMVDNLED